MSRYILKGDNNRIMLWDSIAQGRVMEAVDYPLLEHTIRLSQRAEELNKKEEKRLMLLGGKRCVM